MASALRKARPPRSAIDLIKRLAPLSPIHNSERVFYDLAAVPMPMTPAEFAKFIGDETEKWAKVIRAAGIKAE